MSDVIKWKRHDWEWLYPDVPYELSVIFETLREQDLTESEIIQKLQSEHGMPAWEAVLKDRKEEEHRKSLIELMWEL